MKCAKAVVCCAVLIESCLVGAADPPSGYWYNQAPIPHSRLKHCAAAIGSKLYVIGDYPGSPRMNRIDVYDSDANTWTQLANLPNGRGQAACAVANGKLYVFAGNDCVSNCWLTTSACFDPTTNAWSARASLPTTTGRGALSAATVGGKIYVMGGGNSYVGEFNDNFVYDPATDTWTIGPALPTKRSHHAAVVMDNKIFLVGGQHRENGTSQPTILNASMDIYDPATGSWSTSAPMNVPRTWISAAGLHGRIYAIGGIQDPNAPIVENEPTVEEYDPRDDYWRTATDMPAGRSECAAVVVNGELFVSGGGSSEGSANTVFAGIPRPTHGDINNDGLVDFFDIDPFVTLLFSSP